MKRDSNIGVFLRYYTISKKTFFAEHFHMTAYDSSSLLVHVSADIWKLSQIYRGKGASTVEGIN